MINVNEQATNNLDAAVAFWDNHNKELFERFEQIAASCLLRPDLQKLIAEDDLFNQLKSLSGQFVTFALQAAPKEDDIISFDPDVKMIQLVTGGKCEPFHHSGLVSLLLMELAQEGIHDVGVVVMNNEGNGIVVWQSEGDPIGQLSSMQIFKVDPQTLKMCSKGGNA